MTTTSTDSARRLAECACPEGRAAFSRRGFMALTGAGVATATTLAGARVAFAGPVPQQPTPGTPQDVLVVLSLRGGADLLSAIVPAGDPAYYDNRPGIAIPQGQLRQIDDMFGLHPALEPLFGLWDEGKVAAVQAVGMPNPNRSHFEAMEEMEEAAPGSALRTGWLDRMVGVVDSSTFTATQVGGRPPAAFNGPNAEFALRRVGDVTLAFGDDLTPLSDWREAVAELHAGAEPTLSQPTALAFDAVEQLQAVPEGAEGYGGGPGPALQEVARLIKANVGLRVATVDYGNWDMHNGLGSSDGGWMVDQLTDLSSALAAFAADLGPEFDRVTVLTLSEFGRRVKQNGSFGVDHGYGNAMFVLGGGVAGGKVYGRWPGLADDALVNGDLAVTTDYRQPISEVLTERLEVADLSAVFPDFAPEPLGLLTPR